MEKHIRAATRSLLHPDNVNALHSAAVSIASVKERPCERRTK